MQVQRGRRSVPAAAAALLAGLLVALGCVAPPVPVPNPAGGGGAIGGNPGGSLQVPASAVVPADVEIPAAVAEVDSQPFFDDLSWRTFIALNWPAVEGKRDTPDPNKKLGDPSRAVVWETWKTLHELFQPDGATPSEWDSFEAVSPSKDVANADAGKAKQLASFSSFGTVLAAINEATVGGRPLGPLVAQNRTYVRYEVRVNKAHYNYVRGDPKDPNTGHYLSKTLPKEGGPPLALPVGSIQVKAAWRQFRLPQEKDLLDRYYHVEALLVDPQTKAHEKKIMGLVGLHIVHKTPTRPQWVWSTFEHVDNVVPIGPGAPPNTRPTFQDPDGPTEGAGVNVLPRAINADNPPQQCPDPVQVVRIKPIDDSAQKANDRYHNDAQVKDTVWKYYQLVTTQWPTSAPNGAKGLPVPPNKVANVTMETSVQSTSCMSCHGFAPRTDSVWVLQLRAHPRTPEGAAPAVKALQQSQEK
jgi:hypothetical protein